MSASHRMKPDECPACLTALDSAAEINGHSVTPKPLDFSICIKCGIFLRFDERLQVQIADDDSLSELRPRQLEQMRKAQELIRGGRLKST